MLRPYQTAALVDDAACRLRGARVVCLVAPTGAGKTMVAVQWTRTRQARGVPLRGLWIAHRRELLDQAELAGVIGCRFSMVQAAEATRDLITTADWIVLDECHHLYGTPQWADTVSMCRYRDTLALTATPERGDGAALGNLADAIVVAAQPRQLIADGFLVPCDVIAPAGFTRQMSEHPVTAWRKYADGKKAIVFCRDVAHAQKVADDFRDAGVPAGCVDGKLDPDLRAARLAAHRSGELLVITNVHLLTEGYDDPSVSCAILCAGCSTAGAWLQRVGRIVRPFPGKARATVIDLRGSVYLWGLPDEDRHYSLEGKAISVGGDVTEAIRQCKVCQRVFRAVEYVDATCPACGAKSKGKPDPRVRREAMQKVLATFTVENKKKKFGELIAMGRAKGYKHGWAVMRFKLLFGHWPGKDMR